MKPEESPLVSEYLDPWLAAVLAEHAGGSATDEDPTADYFRPKLDRMLACARLLETVWGTPDAASSEDAAGPTFFLGAESSPRFGRFDIRRELGRGGCGLVFLAFDPQLQRQVALKIPQPGTFVTNEVRGRLLREARAAGLLDHPNIVTVYEVAERGPLCYIASSYCPGPTLAGWLRDRRAPVAPRLAAQIVATLAEAVHHAHQHGILHRDLKPSNVLLFPADVERSADDISDFPFIPKLTDFGLARFLDQPSDLTHTGRLLGTINYMAPEQAEGRVRDVSTGTDVYGLGIILYQLLTMQTPFSSENELATLQQIRSVEPSAPSRLQREVPPDLDAICLACMQKNPAQRYASAEALRADLHRFLAGEPIVARTVSVWERGWRTIRRAPLLSGLVLLATLAILVALVGQAVYSHRLAVTSHELATALETVQIEKTRAEQALGRVEAEQQQTLLALQRAEAEERKHRNLLYASDMRQAIDAWRGHDLKTGRKYLARQLPEPGKDDLRGVEWHFLQAACYPVPEHDFPHDAPVTDAQVTADGTTLVTSAEDGKLRLWDLNSGRLLDAWPAHLKAARSVALSPNGKQLASGGDDQLVHIWDMDRRRPIRMLGMLKSGIETVVWSPCGRWIAAGARYSEFRVWSADGEQCIQADNDHRHEALVFSADGERLYVPTREHIAVWSMATHSQEKPLASVAVKNVRAMCLVTGGRHLAVSERFLPTIEILDPSTGKLVDSLDGGVDYVQHLSATADGSSLLAAGPDGMSRRIAAKSTPNAPDNSNHVLEVLGAHEDCCTAVRTIGDSRLVTTSTEGRARVWRMEQLAPWSVLGPSFQLNAAYFDASSQRILTATPSLEARPESYRFDGTPSEWQAESGRYKVSPYFWSVSISPDRRWFAVGGVTGEVGIWDLDSGRLVQQLQTDDGNVRSLAFSGDNLRLAAVANNGSVYTWYAAEGWGRVPLGSPLQLTNRLAEQVCFMPNSQLLAIGSDSRDTVVLLDVESQRVRHELSTLFDGNMAFSPDGLHLAVGCEDTRLRVWKVASAELLFETDAVGARPTALHFSPDGRTLLSAHVDATIRVWHLPSGSSLGVLMQSSDRQRFVQSFDISPDGRRWVVALHGDFQPAILLSQHPVKPLKLPPSSATAGPRR